MTSPKRRSRFSRSSRKQRPTSGSTRRLPQARRVALAKVKDHLSRYLRLAAGAEIVITRHGRPAGVLIGFASEEDWFEYRLENDPRFASRVERARGQLRAGRGIRLEDV